MGTSLQALCLQLRRGHWDAAAGRHVKLRGPVKFPLQLDLAPFTGLAASPADKARANDESAAGSTRSRPRSSSSSMGSIFLRQLDQATIFCFTGGSHAAALVPCIVNSAVQVVRTAARPAVVLIMSLP